MFVSKKWVLDRIAHIRDCFETFHSHDSIQIKDLQDRVHYLEMGPGLLQQPLRAMEERIDFVAKVVKRLEKDQRILALEQIRLDKLLPTEDGEQKTESDTAPTCEITDAVEVDIYSTDFEITDEEVNRATGLHLSGRTPRYILQDFLDRRG